ncbi:MAG: ATPase, T2SS/T4P/T4SS family [Clostridiales bacterium]|nr:ATPase, T2SS/T4P/T4SS family [Clostridiales bacterium]
MIINLVVLIILLIFLFILGLLFLRQSRLENGQSSRDNPYKMSTILEELNEYFTMYTGTWINDKKMSTAQIKKLEVVQNITRKALHECNLGSISAKRYIKEQIKEWLLNKYGITKENIDKVIPFEDDTKLSYQDMFDIILYYYKQIAAADAFDLFLRENQLTPKELNVSETNEPYIITPEQLEEVFYQLRIRLTFVDKLEILTQRLYQNYKGHGPVDELRDMNIDGISGGVSGSIQLAMSDAMSGMPINGIWVFYHGLMIHLEFLAFSSYEELQKICRNIYRYGKPGQLSAVRGYIVNEMMDGSRVVVVRPPFSESWSFFVRKFDYRGIQKLSELITDCNSELVIKLLELLIQGEQIIGITGEQGSGKTTLLKSLIRFIPASYTLRVQELVFELHLREIYPERNIVSFRETAEISGREGLDLQKKTDGTVNIIGEVASAPVASWLVMISQVASKFTLFTHHAKTTQNLVLSLRNDLMITGAFHNEQAATEQVKASIRFDVHMTKDIKGHRFIERISEIVPSSGSSEIEVNEIMKFENGAYHLIHPISKITRREIYSHLNDNLKKSYDGLFSSLEKGSGI